MASQKVLSVVRGAGLLTTIFAGLANAMRKLAGEGKEELVEEHLHHLSTPEGKSVLDLMAEIAMRGKMRFFDAIKPGAVITFYHVGKLISFVSPLEPGQKPWETNQFLFCGNDDKLICDFLHSEEDFQGFVSLLAIMSFLNYRKVDQMSTDTTSFEFWKYEVAP